MSNQTYPTDLTDRQWACIQDHIPVAPRGRPRSLDMRQLINAILYLLKSGGQWRMLPCNFPHWPSVYYYFRAWRDNGLWRRIHDTIRAELRRRLGRHKHATAGCLDSQSVKSSAVAGERGYDNGKKVKGRKRHILVDTLGLLITVVVTVHRYPIRRGPSRSSSGWVGQGKKLHKIWVDGTYRGKLVDWVTDHLWFRLEPVLRTEEMQGFVLLKRRWVVERVRHEVA